MRWRLLLKQFLQRRLAAIGLAIFLGVGILGIVAPVLSPFDSQQTNLQESLQPPSSEHFMGTDNLGRDIFSEILWGARNSLRLAIGTVAMSVVFGVLIGGVAGYHGGVVDIILSRFIDTMLVMPRVLVAMVLVAILGPSAWNITLALTVAFTPIVARLVRAEYLTLKSRLFVDAARVIGVGRIRIMATEILPLTLPLIIVTATFLLGQAVLAEAMLSFLGLNDPNVSSWGKMVFASQGHLRFGWWTGVFPGFAITLTVLGLNLAGDGFNEVANPKTARVARRWRPTSYSRGTLPEDDQLLVDTSGTISTSVDK